MYKTLMIEFEIFPRFKDFVVLFGARHDESETGLPQLRSRRILLSASETAQQFFSGIGNLCA